MNLTTGPFPEIIPALISDGFYHRAALLLGETLSREPQNAAGWERLIQICRASGDLDQARRACDKRRQLPPEHPQIEHLSAILSGQSVSASLAALPPSAILPSPFVCVHNFLPETEHARLLEFVGQQETTVVATRIGKGGHRPEARLSKRARKSETRSIEPWVIPRIRKVLPELLCRLLPQQTGFGDIELQVTTHGDGDFYFVHRDDRPEMQTRIVSYVYYFHHSPKGFTGGDLLLYDTDAGSSRWDTTFTRIEPVDNMILFFPSAYFHQVTPVHCATGDFRHGRFTINGWVHEGKLMR